MLLDKEKKFEEAFRSYFKELHSYAYRIIRDEDTAEEIVQQVFLRLWEKDWQADVLRSVRAYLYRAVHNHCLNLIKRGQVKQRYESDRLGYITDEGHMEESDSELKRELLSALSLLPEKSRTVFEMSRFQELKYQEIADTLQLSVKTVEGHMTKVLRHLRVHLADYLGIMILIHLI